MATPRTSPKAARSARAVKPKARAVKVKKAKTKSKSKAKAKPKASAKAQTQGNGEAKAIQSAAKVKAKIADVAGQARKAIGPEIDRLKKASVKVEARLKAVSAVVTTKLAAFEDIVEQQLKSEKNKVRIGKLEKDVDRLISSAEKQFVKVRGALDEELKDLKMLLNQSAGKVIPAAKERIAALIADQGTASDIWEFHTDKAGKWRWSLKGADGKAIGASNQAYKNRADCTANARRLGYKGG